ncbi:MAG: DUF484 family protein [Pseudomonadota bacterium]|nr:DUF484 family protein [Pseudomonadota bacterium]
MGSVIQFEQTAVAALREKLGAAESARADLLAYARGHSGAVATIHHAVIAALDADSFDDLIEVVTRGWPSLLGLEAVALALIVGDKGFRIDACGVEAIEPLLVERALGSIDEVALRAVGRGHPLFGPGAEDICTEALIGLDGESPYPRGILLLGQSASQAAPSDQGASLLQFLGASLGAMLRRWARTN